MPEHAVYCASPAAIEAAARAYIDADTRKLADALIAVHDPALGLDRSVCLRDVVEALERAAGPDTMWRESGGPVAYLTAIFGGARA